MNTICFAYSGSENINDGALSKIEIHVIVLQ